MRLIAEATEQPTDPMCASPVRDENEFIEPALERTGRAVRFVVLEVRMLD